MEETVDYSEKIRQSDRYKVSIAEAVLAASDDGVLVLDPPFQKSGADINRVLVKRKHGEKLAKFEAQLGGDNRPTYRFVLFTSDRFSEHDGDKSFKQKWWDCFPEIYEELLAYVRAYIAKPVEEEKRRRK